MSQRTRDEWMLYPEAEDVTLRCKGENIHKASGLSDRELSHTTLFGRGRKCEQHTLLITYHTTVKVQMYWNIMQQML